MSNLSSIIDRVQKLLAMSKCDNANEAAAFAAAANKLIDAHRLTEADLEVKTNVVESLDEDEGYIYQSGRVNPWKVQLVRVLITHYGLTYWNDADWSGGRKLTRFRLIGRKSDIAIAKYMFAWLAHECQRLCDAEARGRGHIFAGSYCMGFVQGVHLQLKNSRIEVQKDVSSTAIVKIDARGNEAREFMYKLRPYLRPANSHSKMRYDADAFIAGKSKGESIHLGTSLGSGSNIKLLNR